MGRLLRQQHRVRGHSQGRLGEGTAALPGVGMGPCPGMASVQGGDTMGHRAPGSSRPSRQSLDPSLAQGLWVEKEKVN